MVNPVVRIFACSMVAVSVFVIEIPPPMIQAAFFRCKGPPVGGKPFFQCCMPFKSSYPAVVGDKNILQQVKSAAELENSLPALCVLPQAESPVKQLCCNSCGTSACNVAAVCPGMMKMRQGTDIIAGARQVGSPGACGKPFYIPPAACPVGGI